LMAQALEHRDRATRLRSRLRLGLLEYGRSREISAPAACEQPRLSIFRGCHDNSFELYCGQLGGRGHAMVFVEVRLNSLDLENHMADMRMWLDRNRIETAGFSYKEYIDRVLAHLAFNVTVQAEAFADRFGGRVISGAARLLPKSRRLTLSPW
jgi:hypothetical protein